LTSTRNHIYRVKTRYALYLILDPCSGMPRYVGMTTRGFHRRTSEHLKAIHDKRFKTHLYFWLRVLHSKGLKPFFELVRCFEESTRGEEALCDAEIDFISLRSAGADLTNTARGGKGKSSNGRVPWNKGKSGVSAETSEKMRSEKVGKVSPRKGVILSSETKEKLRVSHLGKAASPETKEKMSLTHRLIWKRRKNASRYQLDGLHADIQTG